MQWFRLYDDLLDDPKCQQLDPKLFKHWVNLLCLANKNTVRGTLPDLNAIAFRLRVTVPQAVRITDDLASAGLLDRVGETLRPHNWDERQKRSDNVADRVAKHRSNVSGNTPVTLHVTPGNAAGNVLDTDTDTDTDQSREETPPTPSRGKRKTPLTDLPPDFAVTDAMRQWARGRYHFTDAVIDAKTEHFLNYVQKTGKQYAKWDIAWKDAMGWELRAPPPVGESMADWLKNGAVAPELRR